MTVEFVVLQDFLGISDAEMKVRLKCEKEFDALWMDGKIDESLYQSDDYLFIALNCFVRYSKKFALQTLNALSTEKLNTVLDYGAGLGFTTKMLAEGFNNATIFCQNLKGSRQLAFCEKLLSGYNNVKVVDEIDNLGVMDLICCWELFEHIKEPLLLLKQLLSHKPRYLSISNSFGAKAYGHHSHYVVEGQDVSNSAMSRIFNAELRKSMYVVDERCKIFWNRRPTIWCLTKNT